MVRWRDSFPIPLGQSSFHGETPRVPEQLCVTRRNSASICGNCGRTRRTAERMRPDSLRARFELRSRGCFWFETPTGGEIPLPRDVINASVYVSRAPAASACAVCVHVCEMSDMHARHSCGIRPGPGEWR